MSKGNAVKVTVDVVHLGEISTDETMIIKGEKLGINKAIIISKWKPDITYNSTDAVFDFSEGKLRIYKALKDALLNVIPAENPDEWAIIADGGTVQSDWNETDETSDAFIKNKPEIPTRISDFEDTSSAATPINYANEANFAQSSQHSSFADQAERDGNNDIIVGTYARKDELPTKLSDLTDDSSLQNPIQWAFGAYQAETDVLGQQIHNTYAKKAELPAKISELEDDTEATPVQYANKAYCDEYGANIASNYQLKSYIVDKISASENLDSEHYPSVKCLTDEITLIYNSMMDYAKKSELPTKLTDLEDDTSSDLNAINLAKIAISAYDADSADYAEIANIAQYSERDYINNVIHETYATKEEVGEIEAALDKIIAIQNTLIGGEAV